jgi:hypothetical protein
VSGWIKSGGKVREKSKAKRKIKRRQKRNSLKRARQAHSYTTDGKLRVEQQISQPVDQPETEKQEAKRHSPKEWDAALSLINLSREPWVNEHQTCHTPEVATATLQLLRLHREDAELARHLTFEDVQAALALVNLKACQAGKQQATHRSSEEWDAALSLIDLSRKPWVYDTPTCHAPDVEAAARQLIRLQREDARLARNFDVEDVGAASVLVKASRESVRRDSVAASLFLHTCNDRNVDSDVTLEDLDSRGQGLDH